MRHHRERIYRADTRGQQRLRRPNIEALEERSLLATITVTGTGDTIAKDGVVTLREAITAANTNVDPSGDSTPGDPGQDTIAFNIPGAGVRTINLTSALPTVTDPIIIDGYSQPGSRANTLADGDDAVLLIELSRGDLPINGLTITAGDSTVRGLVINGNITPGIHGIELRSNGGNLIEGNFIGPDATGTADVGTQGDGVFIHDAASNTIGGTTPAARNVISGNSTGSILILGNLASGNLVEGNFIGTNAAGTARLTPTEAGGVAIFSAPNTTIGGTTSGARNVITGSSSGIGIRDAGATGTLVQGNYIGIDVTGTTALAPSGSNGLGLAIGATSNGTTIGGTTAAARNIISGNPGGGLSVVGFMETNTLVQGNYIGTDASGVAAVPNGGAGVQVGHGGPAGTMIGGTTPEARNIISGNHGDGVQLADSSGSVVQGNFIGINVNRDPLGNSGEGVFIDLAGATIGGTRAAAGNVISFNGLSGVRVFGLAGSPVNINNRIGSNSIFANGGLGINLGNDGVTPNDPGDADVGPNNLQNFPLITAVSSNGSSTTVAGTLNSTPMTTFRLEFFANGAADASSFGEGQVLLGSTDVTTDAAGDATFNVTLPVPTTPSQAITATATDPAGNTSEFSQLVANLAVTSTDSADPAPAGADLTYTITVTNSGNSSPSGPVTLTDTLPADVTFISATGGASPVQGVLTFDLGIVPIGGSATVRVVVQPDAAAVGTTITNTATVTSTVSDPDAGDNTSTTTTAIVAASAGRVDLSVVLTKAPDPVMVGHDLTYTITVHNGAANNATGVKLTDRLPAGVTFVSATGGVSPSDGILTFDLGTLGGGSDATVTVVVVPEAAGHLINSAEAKANEADAVATDNADSLDTEVFRIATRTTVTPSTTTGITGDVVQFVVSVAHPPGTGAGPTGLVTLHDGATDLGSAPIDAGGITTFTIPNLGLGSHAITASYAGDDRYEASDAAAVTVRIDPAPQGSTPTVPGGPIAVSDEYRMLARARLAVSTPQSVLRNDLGAGGHPTQARLVEGTGHGRLVFHTDGTFRYVPRANFHGTDSFTYVARDRGGDSVPSVVRIRVESLQLERRTAIVPGDSPDLVSLRFTWRLRDALFNNELGVIRVDDSNGSIGGIRPGDPSYLRAAASAARIKVVFRSGESAGISRDITLRGGERFLVYLVQDRSTAMVLARNAENRAGRSPRVFYADPAANPDHFDHVRVGEREGGLSLAWEDLLGGGDRDFNDMVLTIRAIRMGP
jgi:uncharacterized repeat protein (TIGR01451 family)